MRIRRVVDTVLRPGDFSTLTADRGNIHALVADEYTELLDVFTPTYQTVMPERMRWYERSAKPIDGTDVFEAWTV